ncbi:MAG: SRPBCC domain-containing protein [Hyphomonadaceae bacterium]
MSKITSDSSAVDEATIIMFRMFDAPIDKVWECFTKPEHVSVWFGGVGFSAPVCEMDVRVGGIWKHVMRTPDGTDFPLEYVYLEVKKPTRLVWQPANHGKSTSGPPTNRTAVTLEDHGDRTKWTMVATFTSMEGREASIRMGYTNTIAQGCEKFNELVKAL